jgi:hypothetical protein
MICASSDFFKRAMSNNWKEAAERTIRFPDDDPDIFRLYIHWLYSRTLPCRNDEPGRAGNAEYVLLAKAYVLGDKLQDGRFQDTAIDAIIQKASSPAKDGQQWLPVGSAVGWIYDNTLPSSEARRLLVDLYVCHGSGDWLTLWAKPADLPKDFLLDLAAALLDRRPRLDDNSPLRAPSTCMYHQHSRNLTVCYKDQMAEEA